MMSVNYDLIQDVVDRAFPPSSPSTGPFGEPLPDGTLSSPSGGGSIEEYLGDYIYTNPLGTPGLPDIFSSPIGSESEQQIYESPSQEPTMDGRILTYGWEDVPNIWHPGSYGSSEESLIDHYDKHGEEVGAQDEIDYMNQARNLQDQLRRARGRTVSGSTHGVVRKERSGRYVDIAPNGKIISYGRS